MTDAAIEVIPIASRDHQHKIHSHSTGKPTREGWRTQGNRLLTNGFHNAAVPWRNESARSFFYGVDVSKVFSAGDIAENKAVTVFQRTGVNVRAALAQLRDYSRDLGVVLEYGNKYRGMVNINTLAAAIDKHGDTRWDDAFIRSVQPASCEMDLKEVLSMVAASEYPVPVINGDGSYEGIIDKKILLQTLDRAG
jgi:glycine betaine/proline transport system ATP-binding protein